MTKTKTIKVPTGVEQAKQAVLHAESVVSQLKQALRDAEHELWKRQSLLHGERIKADRAWPQARILRPWGHSEPVAIVKRTKATVYTRQHGSAGTLDAWRMSSGHDGVKRWRDYPGPCQRWLEIDGEDA